MFLSAKQCLSISEKISPLTLGQQPHPDPFMSWICAVVTLIGITLITFVWE
jgi:hypothetical protein